MAFLCPVRIPRRRRKRHDAENSTKNNAPKGRITGSNSVDPLAALGKNNDEEEIDFEPRKMVVLHDFIPCVEDEVPVQRGEHVKALYQETDWIYIIKLDNKEGFVPYTYCVSEEEYEKRKEKQRTSSSYRKDVLKSPFILDAMATQPSLEPAEFSKQNLGEFIVKFHFDAIDEDDVSVRKGEIVQVLNKEDQDWYWVKKKSCKEGFIPKNFVTKVEQTPPSTSLVNPGQLSRSNPNIYTSSKMSPHSTVIAASSCTSFSRPDQPSNPASARVIPLLSTGTESMDYSSNVINSSHSSSQTPIISASQSSSMSRIDQNSPYSNKIQNFPVSTSVVQNNPGESQRNNRQSSPNVPDASGNVFSSVSQVDTIAPTPRGLTASTLLMTDENHNLKQQNLHVSFKPFSSMSRIDQRHFTPDNLETHPLSHSLGRNYHYQSRRSSNELLLYGQELVCTDTYVGRKVDDLTVYKGDWIYADMKYRDGRGWIWAYSPATKNQGFVPKSCLRPPATTPL